MVQLPHHVSPTERGPDSYAAHIKQYNLLLQERVREAISEDQVLTNLNSANCALFATGSDGRLEKGPVSGLEFVLLATPKTHVRKIDAILPFLYSLAPKLVDDNIEVKRLEKDSMNRYENNPLRVYPMRITDLSYLAGDRDLENEAKRRLVAEWISENGKSIAERVKSKKKEHQRVNNTGIQQYNSDTDITHFDLEKGVAFYNPDQKKLGFKAGPLRFVQFAIMHELIAYYRRIEKPEENDLILRLPANTTDKILYLETEGLLQASPLQVADLVNCYNHFLWLYHCSQEESQQANRLDCTFNVKDVRERLAAIDIILKDGIMKK